MPPKRAREAIVKIDQGLKRRWLEAVDRLRTARSREAAGWDDLYEALGDILDSEPPLYLAGGHETARAFLATEAPGQDERTVRRYVRVARYFDPADEQAHGVAKLEALLDWLEASGGVPLAPAKIAPERQKVRVDRGGETRRVLFPEASVAEIRAATRAARRGRSRPGASPFEKALRKALARARLGGVSVRVRKDHVDLGAIPRDRLRDLGKALAGARLDELRG